jgi:hypothetical protein
MMAFGRERMRKERYGNGGGWRCKGEKRSDGQQWNGIETRRKGMEELGIEGRQNDVRDSKAFHNGILHRNIDPHISSSTRCIPCKWSSLMRLLPL